MAIHGAIGLRDFISPSSGTGFVPSDSRSFGLPRHFHRRRDFLGRLPAHQETGTNWSRTVDHLDRVSGLLDLRGVEEQTEKRSEIFGSGILDGAKGAAGGKIGGRCGMRRRSSR